MLFAKDIEAERARGRHLGLSDLRQALKSTMFTSPEDRDPAHYGLTTPGELALALEVIASKAKLQENRVRVVGIHQ